MNEKENQKMDELSQKLEAIDQQEAQTHPMTGTRRWFFRALAGSVVLLANRINAGNSNRVSCTNVCYPNTCTTGDECIYNLCIEKNTCQPEHTCSTNVCQDSNVCRADNLCEGSHSCDSNTGKCTGSENECGTNNTCNNNTCNGNKCKTYDNCNTDNTCERDLCEAQNYCYEYNAEYPSSCNQDVCHKKDVCPYD